jgi:hypothetical protein
MLPEAGFSIPNLDGFTPRLRIVGTIGSTTVNLVGCGLVLSILTVPQVTKHTSIPYLKQVGCISNIPTDRGNFTPTLTLTGLPQVNNLLQYLLALKSF